MKALIALGIIVVLIAPLAWALLALTAVETHDDFWDDDDSEDD